MTKDIKRLPAKLASKGINPAQGVLDLAVDKEVDVNGIGMGVLSDGTPFLNQRGLARLCGVQNAHIGTIGTEWNEVTQKPRITTIKELLRKRSEIPPMPYIHCMAKGKPVYAYPDDVCLAILEYYAFEAGVNCRTEAKDNFRILAGSALHDFIYTQVGYSPSASIPVAWRQFHDRVTSAYGGIPDGYFSVFKEAADVIVTLIRAGADVGIHFVPDISIGQRWSKHWSDNDFDKRFGQRIKYPHSYPDYFPQALSNPQEAHCYPEQALAEFRRWMRETYLQQHMPTYLAGVVKKGTLPSSFVSVAMLTFGGTKD